MTTTTQPARRKRVITLTGRPPVRIIEAEWPVIACAQGDHYAGDNRANNDEHWWDRWSLRVRQHEDGRALVYGTWQPGELRTSHSEEFPTAAGELLQTEDYSGHTDYLGRAVSLCLAIERVGKTLGLPGETIADCIADLPSVEI